MTLSDNLKGIASAASLKKKLDTVILKLRQVPWQKTTPTTTQTQPGHTNPRESASPSKGSDSSPAGSATSAATSATNNEKIIYVIKEMLICLNHGSHANLPLVQTLLVQSQLDLNLSPTDVNSKLQRHALGTFLTALPGLLTDIKLSIPCLQTNLETPTATTLLSRLLGNLFRFLTEIYTLNNWTDERVAYRNKLIQGIMKQTANLSIQLEQQASEERINLNQTTPPNSKDLNDRIHCSVNVVARLTQLKKQVTDAIELATFILMLHDFFNKNKIKVHIKTDHSTTMIPALMTLSDNLKGIASAASLKKKLDTVILKLRQVPWQKTTPTTTQTQPDHTNPRKSASPPKGSDSSPAGSATSATTSAATSAKKRKNDDGHSPQGDSPLCSGTGSKKQKTSSGNRHRFRSTPQPGAHNRGASSTTKLPDQKNVRPQLRKKRSTHSHQPTSTSQTNGSDASSAAAETPTTSPNDSLYMLSSFC